MKETVVKHSSTNTVYVMGFIGAAIYFISTASGFWSGVLGVIKALLWPGFLVYEVCNYLSL